MSESFLTKLHRCVPVNFKKILKKLRTASELKGHSKSPTGEIVAKRHLCMLSQWVTKEESAINK